MLKLAIMSSAVIILFSLVKKVEAAENNSVSQNEIYLFKVRSNQPTTPSEENKFKFMLDYDEEEAVSDMDDETATTNKRRLLRDPEGFPYHRFVIAASNTSYGGSYEYNGSAQNITQKTMTHQSSSLGTLARYQYAPNNDYLFESEINYFSASSAASRGGTGSSATFLTSYDSTEAGYSVNFSGNYCWLRYEGGSSVCPGLDLGYDLYPVLSIRGIKTNPVQVEMHKTAAFMTGLNLIGFLNLSRSWLLNWSAGYRMAIGGGTDALTNSSANAYYATSDFIWSILDQHGVFFGLSYTKRAANLSSRNRNTIIDTGLATTSMVNMSLGYTFKM